MAIIYGRAASEKELIKLYPKSVQSVDDIDRVHQDLKDELKTPEKGFFGKIKTWNKKQQLHKFEKNKDDPFHAGASGELQVLQKLSELSDDFHVLCGLNLYLPFYVTYNGKKNLRSAQIDFVVVSTRGVVLIEVKNWSNKYYNLNKNLSPHEQVDRASRILWISLKSWRSPKNPSVKPVVVSIKGNIPYDPNFKFVLASDLDRINTVLQNRKEEFSENEVGRIVDRLKDHVTI